MGHKDLAVELVAQGAARVLNPEHVHSKEELYAFSHAKELISSLESAEREADRAGRGVWAEAAQRRRKEEAAKARAAAISARQRAKVLANVGEKGKEISSFVVRAAKAAAARFKAGEDQNGASERAVGPVRVFADTSNDTVDTRDVLSASEPTIHGQSDKRNCDGTEVDNSLHQQHTNALGVDIKHAVVGDRGQSPKRSERVGQETDSTGKASEDNKVSNSEEGNAKKVLGRVAGALLQGGIKLTDHVVKPVGKAAWNQGVKTGTAVAEALIEREKKRRREK